ncbi:flavodoxin family protein [Robertkochia solimangrovi]|uniref:flavodoxin family protein n=1 Tax=Robertkochia solimangrovi TaxID=2213046 RepID=UPI0011811FB9|nr:flavodoxin family protein [Robertkochia solimangrovi]TRZ44294.1 FMN reductase [Robertkochia solimangrovi]
MASPENTVIIAGSSRKEGDTARLVKDIATRTRWSLIFLNDVHIEHYNYEHRYRNDDFLNLMEQIITYDTIIFATPVYWYAMSGRLKVFIDRLTDLLKIHKELGRQLRGKNMGVVTSSNGGNLGEDFWIPFKAIAEYLGMNYIADLHTIENESVSDEIDLFIQKITKEAVDR